MSGSGPSVISPGFKIQMSQKKIIFLLKHLPPQNPLIFGLEGLYLHPENPHTPSEKVHLDSYVWSSNSGFSVSFCLPRTVVTVKPTVKNVWSSPCSLQI